jgi:hypothetical protein
MRGQSRYCPDHFAANEETILKKERKAFFIATSLLVATAFAGVAAQASTSTANTPASVVGTSPQQMASPSPSPMPT